MGERIKAARESKVWGQAELARKAGISPNTLYRIEAGTHAPRPITIRRIAEVLGMDPAELARDTGNYVGWVDVTPGVAGSIKGTGGTVLVVAVDAGRRRVRYKKIPPMPLVPPGEIGLPLGPETEVSIDDFTPSVGERWEH